MKINNRHLKVLIFVFAGLIALEAVSIGVLWMKNARLKHALLKKEKLTAVQPKKIPLSKRPSTKVAIVLDDWGYNTNNVSDLFNIGEPITISVLPNLPFSKKIASQAAGNNIEAILHLPLEPNDSNKPPEKDTIYTYMNQKDVLSRLESALDSVPGAKGVSNHMGSKATEDEKLMRLIFTRLKKNKLYFLDSLVTNNSVCWKVASKVGIKFTERSVFLDNNNNPEYIMVQLRQLLKISKLKGTGVGIGHDRALTIKTLKEMLPVFKREGVKLVYLSELVK